MRRCGRTIGSASHSFNITPAVTVPEASGNAVPSANHAVRRMSSSPQMLLLLKARLPAFKKVHALDADTQSLRELAKSPTPLYYAHGLRFQSALHGQDEGAASPPALFC